MIANENVEVSLAENGIELKGTKELEEKKNAQNSPNNNLNNNKISSLIEADKDVTVGIIGNGDYGKALATRFMKLGIVAYSGSRDPKKDEDTLVTYEEAASKGNIIFLAIPCRCYDEVVPPLESYLQGKIVVDISNPVKESDGCNAIQLSKLLPNSYILKAFNTVSAWAMENDIFGGSRETYICGDDRDGRQILSQLVIEMGFTPIDRGRLRAAEFIEKIPFRLFPEWRTAWLITLIVFLLELFYYWLRWFGAERGQDHEPRHKIPFHANKLICWTSIWLLALVFLPGCIAGYLQLYRGTKYKSFPEWLDTWMKVRKQLGLIALMFAWVHGVLSFILLAGGYIKRMRLLVPVPGTDVKIFREYKWTVEVSFMFATLALTGMTVLGITSLPTVNARMTWREWDFIQSKTGWVSLIFATAHLLFYVYFVYEKKVTEYHWDMPPPIFVMPLLPLLVLLLKLILLLPGIYGRLERIKQGWEKKNNEVHPKV